MQLFYKGFTCVHSAYHLILENSGRFDHIRQYNRETRKKAIKKGGIQNSKMFMAGFIVEVFT